MNTFLWIYLLIAILFSAFFSGMEIAFVSSDKLRLELDKNQNSFHSRILKIFTKNPNKYITTMLVGNNIALVIYGIIFVKLLEPFLEKITNSDGIILLLQTIFSTLIILFAGEFIPKKIFRLNPNRVLRIFALPLLFIYYIFYPITHFCLYLSRLIVNSFFKGNLNKKEDRLVFSRIDLDHLVNAPIHEGKNEKPREEDNEIKLFRNALDFSKIRLREIMIPRPEMVALDIKTATIEELRQKFIETGYSRILFYQGNIDNIIGYVHHSSIFTHPQFIRPNLKDVIVVPETMPAKKLLKKFIRHHRSIAIIVDEFGGTAGMVTSEDILEEILGEIEDEHDTIDLIDKKISNNEYLLSARIELDTLNEKYDLGFPHSKDYETLAGYILFYYENIPKINTIIKIDKFLIKILKATHTRIDLINLKIIN